MKALVMTPEISEFSYGFAITNEIVGWAPLTAAPIFPSLIEEGKSGGGYDVNLDIAGFPLYLQFKRADCMIRKSVAEIRDYRLPLRLPFYRFKITESGKSHQHELLLDLDDGQNSVFYVAPRFHKLDEINLAWSTSNVATRSIFVKPARIGHLDARSHHVAYDHNGAFLCSEPEAIEYLDTQEVVSELLLRLQLDPRPLREHLPAIIKRVSNAVSRRRDALATKVLVEDALSSKEEALSPARSSEVSERQGGTRPISSRAPIPISGDKALVRDLAELTNKALGMQLILIQPRV